jgi:O-methyltransferase involved in polyketide biosynthesis
MHHEKLLLCVKLTTKKKKIEQQLSLIAEDIGKHKLIDVLRKNAAWDQHAPSVIIAEGLVMYLSPESVRDLFCQCAEISGDCSRVVFTYIPSGEDGRPDAGPWSGLMLWLQKVAGEPWLWSIQPEELGLFLAETGWKNDTEQVWAKRKYGVEFYAAAIK